MWKCSLRTSNCVNKPLSSLPSEANAIKPGCSMPTYQTWQPCRATVWFLYWDLKPSDFHTGMETKRKVCFLWFNIKISPPLRLSSSHSASAEVRDHAPGGQEAGPDRELLGSAAVKPTRAESLRAESLRAESLRAESLRAVSTEFRKLGLHHAAPASSSSGQIPTSIPG